MSAPRPPDFPQREDLSPYWQTRVLGAAILIAALALVVWQAYVSVGEPPPEDLGGTAAVAAAPASQPTMPRTFPQAARAVPVAAVATPLAADESEVCGIGRIKTAELERDPRFEAAQRRALDGLQRGLGNSTQELSRVTALALRAVAQEPISSNCQGADCAVALPQAGAAEAREDLARLAIGTSSPVVYALALRVCERQRAEGSCNMLSLQQWSRLDPANAVPWLATAHDASRRHEMSTVHEAMYRASLAQTVDAGETALLGAVLSGLPADLSPLERSMAMNDAFEQVIANFTLSATGQSRMLVDYCSADAVRNANRQQGCAALAEVMVNKGRSLFDVALGTAIGARAGWPAERVEALKREREAMFQVSLRSVSVPTFWSCESLERQSRYFQEVAALGEVGGLRRAIQRSGVSTESLSAEYRAAMRAASAAR